ncbi:hypothetical protein BJY01DRAFT_256379 [Aspergillus pseudoustus]|uniref:Uncharacterized protein n=1 Tax=Aspergillus pseudoustus TaxID=1810923 RepID=A0ABR4IDF5_9EURO
MWREKLRRHKDRHRRCDARKSSNDYVSRERDGVETGDACLADTEETSKQGSTGLKQEDLDNFREQLDGYATLIANLSTLCRFLTSRAPASILLQVEELSRASPKLLPFVKNGPHTAILPQTDLPLPIDLKECDRLVGWSDPAGGSTAQSSPNSEIRVVQRSQPLQLQPQGVRQPSAAQGHIPTAPKEAAAQAWISQAGLTSNNGSSREMVGQNPPERGSSGQPSMTASGNPGMVSGEQQDLASQLPVEPQALSDIMLAARQPGPASTLTQQAPYAIVQNPVHTAQTGLLQQTYLGPSSAALQRNSGLISGPAAAQFSHVGLGNQSIQAATLQPNQLGTVLAQPAQGLSQLSMLSQPQTGQVVGQGWPGSVHPLSAPQTTNGYPNTCLYQPTNIQAMPSIEQGNQTQPTHALIQGLDNRSMINRGVEVTATAGQPAVSAAASQWLTPTQEMTVMSGHQDNYLNMLGAFTNTLG